MLDKCENCKYWGLDVDGDPYFEIACKIDKKYHKPNDTCKDFKKIDNE